MSHPADATSGAACPEQTLPPHGHPTQGRAGRAASLADGNLGCISGCISNRNPQALPSVLQPKLHPSIPKDALTADDGRLLKERREALTAFPQSRGDAQLPFFQGRKKTLLKSPVGQTESFISRQDAELWALRCTEGSDAGKSGFQAGLKEGRAAGVGSEQEVMQENRDFRQD